jgi:cyanophycinase-like exopeptidase
MKHGNQSNPFTIAVLSFVLLALAWMGNALGQEMAYRYFSLGDPTAAVTAALPPSRSSMVLMGGGPDVDQAFRWMIRKAGIMPGTGGRFVVLRANGTGAYNPYIYYSGPDQRTGELPARNWVGGAALGLSSVETLVIPSRAAANNPFVNDIVGKADAVFIAGGDQSQYIRFWKGTALDKTLMALLERNVPIGGTSAGLAILGEYSFAALQGGIDSTAALTNPFDPRITLDPDPRQPSGGFLAPAPLAGILTDSHFDRRRRMGRLVAFLARLGGAAAETDCLGGDIVAGDGEAVSIRGIGVSEQTALLVENTPEGQGFIARRVRNPWSDNEGAVYFVRPLTAPRECLPGVPLTIDRIEIRKLSDSSSVFNLSDWTGVESYIVNVEGGQFDRSPY